LDEFIGLLVAHGVHLVADVRRMPRSRANPQFNQETLPEALAEAGLRYVHLPELAGLRRKNPDSTNTAWRNASFRAYADYMQTAAFADALDQLVALAETTPVALMCAEAVPWRCHRGLIADALTARGIQVLNIMDKHRADPHVLRAFAHVDGTQVSYPGPEDRAAPHGH